MAARRKVLIMGAAGRDFHNFNLCYRGNESYEVVGFTATQIPDIDGRVYPPELAGPGYPQGVPIFPEEELPDLIRRLGVDEVVFAYSDVPHEYVMHRASVALAEGVDFRLLGPARTMLKSSRPVIAVTAVRTGAGKSPATRRLCRVLEALGKKTVVVRHPMPYGDLTRQVCQRFATYADLDKHQCTVEEREEYEPLIEQGNIVYAGVDYEVILRAAEGECDVVIWDGGNNDLPFYVPDLHIVVADPHRPGHELRYHPGEANLRRADVVVISKVDTAPPEGIDQVRANVRALNPGAQVIEAACPIFVDDNCDLRGRRVLVVEDGPTLTHGEMAYGAGLIVARKLGAVPVDPRPYAVGSIKETYARFRHMGPLLPAMGYGDRQVKELEATINATDCDLVVIATPIDLRRVARLDKPTVRVRYQLQEIGQPTLLDVVKARMGW